jgi:hypothetical protein
MISFWFYATFAKHQRKLFPQFKVKELEVFPVPKNIDKQYEVQIETLVDQILIEKSQNPLSDTLELEKKIDELAYKIYHLTDEEIHLIEKKYLKS